MIPAILAYAISCTLILRLPYLPDLNLAFMLLPAVVFGVLHTRQRWLCAFILGGMMGYLTLFGENSMKLPPHLEGRDLTVTGTITHMPVRRDGIARVRVSVDSDEWAGHAYLSWYQPPGHLRPGQVWQMTARLNRPTGSVNFGLFDYEAWLFAKRIHARGYVRSSPAPALLGEAGAGIHEVRFMIREKLVSHYRGDYAGLLLALGLGDTSRLDRQHWDLLAKTGTTHLLIISGLHTGLIAVMAFWVMRRILPNPHLVVIVCVLVTLFYALLAGWGLPAQRAFVMSTVALLAYGLSRNVSVPHQLFAALGCVLLLDPFATLTNGFWLSFGAVAVLMYGMGDRVLPSKVSWTSAAVRAQWVVYIGMMSLLASIIHQIPLHSFLVNLVAIPLIALLAVPLVLVTVVAVLIAQPFGIMFLYVLDLLFNVFLRFLGWAAGADLIYYPGQLDLMTYVAAGLGGLIILAPRGLVPRWLGLIPLLLLMKPAERLNEGEFIVTFLDVGQGLSVTIRTRSTLSVYDTGPTFGTRFSSASSLVLPSIRQTRFARIDHLIISHRDNDHAGGVKEILDAMPVGRRVLTNRACHGEWEADSVEFRLFTAETAATGNDQSCLLLVGNHLHRVLLTGDIESGAERSLLNKALPTVTVMSSPHHGSSTSSTPALLNYVQPEVIVISAGYMNRFSHPSDEVVERYRNRSIRVFNTAHDGAVRISITHNGTRVETARKMRPAIWRR